MGLVRESISARVKCAERVISTSHGQTERHTNGTIKVHANCLLKIDGKEYGSLVTGKILVAETDFKEKECSQTLRNFLGVLVRTALIADLSNSAEYDLFSPRSLKLSTYLNSATSGPFLEPFECDVSPQLTTSIREQIPDYLAAQTAFSDAVGQLRDFAQNYTAYGVRENRSEITRLLGQIESLLNSADLGLMYSWYREKMSGIRSSFSELFKRKRESAPTYQRAKEYICSNLYSFNAPVYWHETPVIFQLEDV